MGGVGALVLWAVPPASYESKQRPTGTNGFRLDAALDVATLDYFAHTNSASILAMSNSLGCFSS